MDDAQYHAIENSDLTPDYSLDVSYASLESVMGSEFRDIARALDGLYDFNSRDADDDDDILFGYESSGMIRQLKSVIRLLQDPSALSVPVFPVNWISGFADMASFESLSSLLNSLQRVRLIVDSSQMDTLREIMTEVKGFIEMLISAPSHMDGEELRMENSRFSNPLMTSLRTCRLSEDPVSEIERIAENFIGSMDFCRGLLFRFVLRETRFIWLETFHTLYDLLEQLTIGHQDAPIRKVRLALLDDHESMMSEIAEIRNLHESDFTSDDMHNMRDLFESILRDIERRSSLSHGYLTRDVTVPGDVTTRDLIGQFLVSAGPLEAGHQYLTVDEAHRFVSSASIAQGGIVMSLPSVGTTTTPTTTPAPILENDEFPMFPIHSPELSWTLSEVFGIIAHLGTVAITELADMSVGTMIMNDVLDNVLRVPETLRLLMDHHDDRVLLKIVDRSYHVNRETTIAVLAEFPEVVNRLITFWEGYNGVHSSKYLFPLLRVRLSDPEFCSALLLRVIKNVAKFRELVNEIIHLGHTTRLPELTEEAVEALMDFWVNRQLRDPLSTLSFMALSPVTDEYCDKLRDARSVLDAMFDQSLATEATRILVWNCPYLGTFPERAALLRDISTGVNRLVVVRDSILDGAIEWFAAADSARIRSGTMKVQFVDEDGMDGGGLGREWYHLVARGIINGMLIEPEPNSGRFVPNSVGENRMDFVGKFIAKAIRDGQRLARMRFAHIVYRYILEGLDGVELDLEMYSVQSREHANTLQWLLDNDPRLEGWEAATRDLSFSVDLIQLGEHSVHELIEGESAIPVTQENKGEYVKRVIEYKMRQSI